MNTTPAAVPLPDGTTVLAGDAGASRLHQVLAASRPDPDPVREGIRVLLAWAWTIAPAAGLAHFVADAGALVPQLRSIDPTELATVARDMALPGMGMEIEVA